MSYVDDETYAGHTFSKQEIINKFREKGNFPAKIVYYKGEWMTVPLFFEIYEPVSYNNMDKVTLKELDEFMDSEMDRVLNSEGAQYYESQTASGKTERIIRYYYNLWLGQRLGKQIYAVPTHNLAIDVENRMREFCPEMPVYRVPQRGYTEKDLLLMTLGLAPETTDQDRNKIIRKLHDNHTDGVFIVTHSLLINLGESILPSGIIIDENIEEALLKNIDIPIADLQALTVYLSPQLAKRVSDMNADIPLLEYGTEMISPVFCDVLDELKPLVKSDWETIHKYIPVDFFNIDNAETVKVSYNKDGNHMLRVFYKSKLITHALEHNIPLKLFTATPMNYLLNEYYGTDFEVVTAPMAENKGKVIQFTNITGARYKQEQYPAKVKEKLSEEQIRNSLLITFKDGHTYYEDSIFNIAMKDDEPIHLMNNAGLDIFKGRDIIVVGKFDKNPKFYKDIWNDIGDGTELDINDRSWHEVELNGFKQKLWLFNNETIRNIQLQYINYATAQTIGRARALRTDANVYVFCDFICADVDVVYH